MIRRPPRSTRTDTLFPYTTLFRSVVISIPGNAPFCLSCVSRHWEDETLPQPAVDPTGTVLPIGRSEEHTSELQSLMRISYAVFCLKKKKQTNHTKTNQHQQSTHSTKLY